MKILAAVQSNYIPWKGYFDLINLADEFVLLDDVQYTVRDWRNRNRIKTPQGPRWLSIPVTRRGRRLQAINEVAVSDPVWKLKHWETIRHYYSRAKYFNFYRHELEELYLDCQSVMLSEINYRFLQKFCQQLNITTPISWSTDYTAVQGKNERLISICKQAGATHYLTGPTARRYLDEELFGAEGLGVIYFDYSDYPVYDQLFPPFDHHVSIIDLILSEGPYSTSFLKTTRHSGASSCAGPTPRL